MIIIANRVVNLHSSIWKFLFLQRHHAILNISFDQPETILRQRVYIHLSLHSEMVTECKLPFLINSATDSLDIRYGLSKLRITIRSPEVDRKQTYISVDFDTLINPTHNNILILYFVSIATNVAPLDLQMSTLQLLYFLEIEFRVDGEEYCYSRSFLLLIYMYKVHHCPIS